MEEVCHVANICEYKVIVKGKKNLLENDELDDED